MARWWVLVASDRGPVLVALLVALGTFVALVTLLTAMVAALRYRNVRVARRRGLMEKRWTETIVRVIGGTTEPDRLLTLVPRRAEVFFVGFLARYARRLRGPERARLTVLVEPFADLLVRQASARDSDTRARAVQTLSLLTPRNWASSVIAALRDRSDVVAMAAARGLAAPEHADLAPHIVAELYRFARWDRAFVTTMLAGIGPALAPSLVAALGDPTRPLEARILAADVLRALRTPESGDAAASALPGADPELAAACLRVLRQVGRPAHLGLIRPHLDAPEFFVRLQALAAVVGLAEADEVRTAAVRALRDRSHWVALEAARALARLARAELERIGRTGEPGAAAAREALAEVA